MRDCNGLGVRYGDPVIGMHLRDLMNVCALSPAAERLVSTGNRNPVIE
jgi:hypothetical protein